MLNLKNQKNSSENFWSGYSLGLLSGGVLMYVFATKKGRDTLKKMLDHSDTVEENITQIIKHIQDNLSPKS